MLQDRLEFRTIDSICKTLLSENYSDIKKYNSLTESEKKETSQKLANNLYRSIKSKINKIDYKDIERSNGDIYKFNGYKDLSESIRYLELMKKNYSNAPKEIDILKDTLTLLQKYKNLFIESFKSNKHPIQKLLYMNLVYSLIHGTSLLISTSVDFVKQPMGEYNAIFKENIEKVGDYHYKQLSSIIQLDKNGKLEKFLSTRVDSTELGIVKESVLTTATIVIATGVMILFFIRYFVFFIYKSRTKVSDYLLNLAYFVESNYKSLDSNNEKMKEVIEKQKKVVEKLLALNEKIKVDSKLANQALNKAMEDDDKEIEDTSDDDGILVI